jgi:hypothetical protein
MPRLFAALSTLALLAGPAAAGQAAAADRFDLNCSLRETNSLSQGETSFTRHLSIDLEAGVVCFRDFDCKKLDKLARVTSEKIVLDDSDDDFMTQKSEIDRRSLRWSSHVRVKKLAPSTGVSYGDCVRAPFTPFPDH